MKNKLNIVIPAGGDGKRFKLAGYDTLKPFIIFKNKTIIENIIIGFISKEYDTNIFILMQEKHIMDYRYIINTLESKYNNVKFLPIKHKTNGTVCTILEYKHLFNNDAMVLSANCDQLANIDIDNFINKSINYDGSLLVFKNENSCNWSYVRIKNDLIIEIADKKPITDVALLGWYFWKKGKTMVKNFEKLISNNLTTNGEYMQNLPYNFAINDGMLIKPIIIDKNDVIPLGTPEELIEQEKKYNY